MIPITFPRSLGLGFSNFTAILLPDTSIPFRSRDIFINPDLIGFWLLECLIALPNCLGGDKNNVPDILIWNDTLDQAFPEDVSTRHLKAVPFESVGGDVRCNRLQGLDIKQTLILKIIALFS